MMIESIIKPKQPAGAGWVSIGKPEPWVTNGYAGEIWAYPNNQLLVISAVEVANDENDINKGPEYHISISKSGGRCTRNESKFVLKAFDMTNSEEDNHVPFGIARNFWMPVSEKLIGMECPCKKSEPAIKENKGDYIWRGLAK